MTTQINDCLINGLTDDKFKFNLESSKYLEFIKLIDFLTQLPP